MNRIGMANKTQSWIKSILLIAIAVSAGWLISTTVPEKGNPDSEDSTMEMEQTEEMAMEETMGQMHEPIDLTNEELIPTIDLIVTEDPKAGWNLEVRTTNFTFTPELASQDPVLNQGHAHLYIDGEKITRLYGPWYYLGEFEEGEYVVSVDLNANDHAPFAVNGEVIQDKVLIHVEASAEDTHAHDSADAHETEAAESADQPNDIEEVLKDQFLEEN